ncbi:MAG: Gfo/Idh/MocA family oxidoreductase [Actinobacteria bacterium]|nr:Gfo/Idh/MocA family oxidoreductase [Actinomycetota bacterium]
MLGVGPRGLSQARAYQQHPRIELFAICDVNPERLAAAAQEFDIPVERRYADLRVMLDHARPDIVNIPTRTDLHAPLTLAVLGHRPPKAIVVEKPMATNLDDADQMLALAKRHGVMLAVSHQMRTTPPFQVAERLLRQGAIGPLTGVKIRGKGYYGGFDMLNIGTHLLDGARRFVGPARGVVAMLTTAGRPTRAEDVIAGPYGFGWIAGENISAQYRFGSGVFASVEFHRRSVVDDGWVHIKLYGEDGSLCLFNQLELFRRDVRDFNVGQAPWQVVELPAADRILHGVDYAANRGGDFWMAEETVNALDAGRDHQCSGAEGLGVMEMMFGAYESHFTGKRIDFPLARGYNPLLRAREAVGLGLPDPAPGELRYKDWLPQELARIGGAA